MSRITDRLNREYPKWEPQQDDLVEGTIDAIKQGEGKYGPYPFVELALDNGAGVTVYCSHTVLRKEIAKARPGDRLGVKYLGVKKKKSTGEDYEGYRIIVEPSPANISAAAAEGHAADLITDAFEEEEPF